jgi:RNA polymerase sigma-70 factor (ECF subfamily)
MGLLEDTPRFDAEYLKRLREGEPRTQQHFSSYFSTLLQIKLANGVRSWQMLQDVRQETLARVLEAARAGSIEQPERLGAFVCSTSNHVLWQYRREEDREKPRGEAAPEPVDERSQVERELIREENKELVRKVLSGLPEKDREVLRLLFLEECSKEEVCRRLGVTPDYLRVLLFRAKERFRAGLGRKARAANR